MNSGGDLFGQGTTLTATSALYISIDDDETSPPPPPLPLESTVQSGARRICCVRCLLSLGSGCTGRSRASVLSTSFANCNQDLSVCLRHFSVAGRNGTHPVATADKWLFLKSTHLQHRDCLLRSELPLLPPPPLPPL